MSALPLQTDMRLEQILAEAWGAEYKSIQRSAEGTTRIGHTADFSMDEHVISTRYIKADKLPEQLSDSPRVVRNFSRGNTTKQEVQIMRFLPEASNHNIIQVHAFKDLAPFGWPGMSAVYEYFPSKPLSELVGLAPESHLKIFKCITDALQYSQSQGVLHRDIKPDNIFVADDGSAKLGDFANAKHMSEIFEHEQGTQGSHWYMDPQLIPQLGGKHRKATPQTELYSLAATMLEARIGRKFAEYDPDKLTGVRVDEGISLLEEGKLSNTQHQQVLDDATAQLPRKERSFYRRALALHEEKRFESIHEFWNAYENAVVPSMLERIVSRMKQSMRVYIPAAAVLLALTGLQNHGVYKHTELSKDPAVQGTRRALTPFRPSVDISGENLEVSNNLVEMVANIAYYTGEKETNQEFKKQGYLHLKRGDRISLTIYGRELPREKEDHAEWLSNVPARVYFEGREAKEFHASVVPHDITKTWGGHGGFYYPPAITIPTDMPDGTHILAVEFYVAGIKKADFGDNITDIDAPAGTILARKRFPIIVGSMKNAVDINSISFNYSADVRFQDLREFPGMSPRGLSYEYRVLDEGKNTVYESGSWRVYDLVVPAGASRGAQPEKKIIQVVARKDGKPILCSYFSIDHYGLKHASTGEMSWYPRQGIPPANFQERMLKPSQEIYSSTPKSGLDAK